MPSPRLDVQDGVSVITFDAGPHTMDEAAIAEIRDAMLDSGAVDPPKLVVDLSQVDFFGSTFIELLFRIWKRLQDRSGQFAICGLSPYCREVLSVTNLHRLWQTYETRDEALKALRGTP
ncbi:MAG: STAS domain-containing protein [Planctomycetaceae bacterium]